MYRDEQANEYDQVYSCEPEYYCEHKTSALSDPFACSCCANVFSEILRQAEIDLGEQAQDLDRREPVKSAKYLLTNANILTMNAGSPIADSMLVENGKIKWIGVYEQRPTDQRVDLDMIDLGGKIVMPGFVEPHMHLAPLAMLRAFENVGPFRFEAIEEVITHLSEISKKKKKGDWVLGCQLDPSLQEGPDYLTREMLDRVSLDHPVFVYNASLHIAYCNSLALNIAGIDRDTLSPPGSEVMKDGLGDPTGVLKAGPAIAMVARHNPGVKQDNIAESCLSVLSKANAVGITTLCDQGTGLFQGIKELDLYENMRASNRMNARLRFSVGHALSQRWDEAGLKWNTGDAWVRVTGWKIVSDGSNQGRTGLQREPFLHSDELGIPYIAFNELDRAVEERLKQGWSVCVHANGDEAIDRILKVYERVHEMGLEPGARRCRIEHCSILHDDQIQKMAEIGISPSFLIGHVYYWGAAFVNDVFGLTKASKLDRTKSCEDLGIRWTIHSDDPVTEMHPLRCIENAVSRSMWKSDEILNAEERIDIDAALRACTIDAAWQCHSDHEVGSLEAGKFADFIVLDSDPRDAPINEIKDIEILETWVDGRQVYQA